MAASATRISIATFLDGEKAHKSFENSAFLKKQLHGELFHLLFPGEVCALARRISTNRPASVKVEFFGLIFKPRRYILHTEAQSMEAYGRHLNREVTSSQIDRWHRGGDDISLYMELIQGLTLE
jgi:hypothetical protein